jgi:putative ABC transport system permease protein
MMGNVKVLINGISLIILFAVTLIVANTVAMSARERVTEIAVMRTLGFGHGHILVFILLESVLMSLLGGIFGVLLAKFAFIPLLLAVGNKTSVSIWLTNFRVSPQTLALAFVVSVGVGILAGFAPAIRSSRLKIVDGLRQVV